MVIALEHRCPDCDEHFVGDGVLCPRCQQHQRPAHEKPAVDHRDIRGTRSYLRNLWREKGYDE
jgi:hypothetical protein